MEIDKKKKLATTLLTIAGVISISSWMMKAEGPLTSALKVFTALSGVGCCVVGLTLQSQANRSNPPK
jgi:hypothetical protein